MFYMSNKDSHGSVQLFLEATIRLLESATVIDKWVYSPEMYLELLGCNMPRAALTLNF